MPFDWDEKPDLNITPLVDVMLVLIAILMLTTPVIMYQEKISLPDGSKKERYEKHAPIEIRVTQKRKIILNKKSYQFEGFADSFIQFAESFPDRKNIVTIQADKRLRYEDVMYILKSVKAAQFTKVSLITDG